MVSNPDNTTGILCSIDAEQKVMSAFLILIACVSLKITNLDTTALKTVESGIHHDASERLLK
jgi:hypothetical protein